MIEHEIIHSNNISERILIVVRDVVEFMIAFIRIFTEILISFLSKIMPPQLKDVSGEVVLITGTGHGIGREIALHYAALGSTVICVDIDENNNEETVNRAKRLNRGTIYSYICDVSNREAVLALAESIKKDVGPVSVLVNNVGIMPTHPLEKHTPAEIYKIFDVNVFSQFWTLEAFLPHMKQQGRGHIIATSSIAGLVGLTNLVPYCATKFAVRGMMEGVYEELRAGPYKDRINISIIYPYMTNTGLCKRPKVKFPTLLGLQDPKEVAKRVIESHRANIFETTVPKSLLYINNWCRLLPYKAAILLKDYIDSGVESDL